MIFKTQGICLLADQKLMKICELEDEAEEVRENKEQKYRDGKFNERLKRHEDVEDI